MSLWSSWFAFSHARPPAKAWSLARWLYLTPERTPRQPRRRLFREQTRDRSNEEEGHAIQRQQARCSCFHTVKETAWQVLCEKQVRRLISRGELPAYRFGTALRIKKEHIYAYAEERPVGKSGGVQNRMQCPNYTMQLGTSIDVHILCISIEVS
jgi:excisionase family DNA binding protein